jgi:hypothetical protein
MSDYLISIFQYLENENDTTYNSRILFLLQSLTNYSAVGFISIL